jgi:DNA-binding LacI/PurR family transcriptional regulator
MPTLAPDTAAAKVPRYQIAERQVAERITRGVYTAGQKLAGIDVLADDLGVSPSTMRQSLQSLAAKGVLECVPGRGTSVSPDAMDILGTPSAGGGGGSGTARTYSLIIPDIRYTEFSTLAHSVQEAARARQFELTISNTEDHLDRYVEELDRTIRHGARGIVLVPPLNAPLPLDILMRLQDSGIPVVTSYRPIELLGIPSVRNDVHASHYLAANHLAKTGCKMLGLVHVQTNSEFNRHALREGLHGHMHAMVEHKLDYHDDLVLSLDEPGRCYQEWADTFAGAVGTDGSSPQEARVQRVVAWLEEHPEIDGVVCYNDYLAPIVAEALKRLGRRVPDDVSIIARGSVGFQMYTPQPVTMVDVNLPEFGRRACELLEQIDAGRTFEPGYYEKVEPTLVVRGTTRPLPSPA